VRFRRDTEEWAAPAREQPERRDFVPPEVTPATLVVLYDEHISSEADGLVAPYAGKWMRVSGPRGTTVPRRRGVTLLRFDRRPGAPHTRVEMRFRETGARQRLDAIPRGTEVVVVGALASITRSQIVLDRCELEESNPGSTPTR
jgi:hypothetical protein